MHCNTYPAVCVHCTLLLTNQIFELGTTQSGMGVDDNGCGSGLLGVTFNNISSIPQTEQHSPHDALHLGKVASICRTCGKLCY